jgi:hypothetical protein
MGMTVKMYRQFWEKIFENQKQIFESINLLEEIFGENDQCKDLLNFKNCFEKIHQKSLLK